MEFKSKFMSTPCSKDHWEHVYLQKHADEVSWYQKKPTLSLDIIQDISSLQDWVIDIGGGISSLVDHLLRLGYENLAVLDIAKQAIEQTKKRLGERAKHVEWHVNNITQFVPPHQYVVWHDRAVFHFLTEQASRTAYVNRLNRALVPGGYVIIATFSKDGPAQCSGLDVVQYDAVKMQHELGDEFVLLSSRHEAHVTPAGHIQNFIYFTYRR